MNMKEILKDKGDKMTELLMQLHSRCCVAVNLSKINIALVQTELDGKDMKNRINVKR